MTLEQAAQYWQARLTSSKPIYRVRVRKLLELAGAERRGLAITQRIATVLDIYGLRTEPDFRTTWIDAQISIHLSNPASRQFEEPGPIPTIDSVSAEQAGDPSFADLDSVADISTACDDESSPVAESLAAPTGSAGVIEVSIAPSEPENNVIDTDPVQRIGSLPSANRGVVSCNLQDALTVATTTMLYEGYSQLAIMQNERNVRGVVSLESIAKRSLSGSAPMLVSECRTDAQIIEADGSLADALPVIEKHGYVLVRSQGRVTGIVTASDLAVELRSITYAFTSIGTIEGLVRKMLHPKLVTADLDFLEEHSRARRTKQVTSITFGENLRLLQRPDIWKRLNLQINKDHFLEQLEVVRELRNEVMHFNSDPLGSKGKKHLEKVETFLRFVCQA